MHRVAHISDLHRDPENPIGNEVLLDSLERDRSRYTKHEDPPIAPPNLIIVSGDIVQGVRHATTDAETKLRDQYAEALDFLNQLTGCFLGGDKQRVIIVPGNRRCKIASAGPANTTRQGSPFFVSGIRQISSSSCTSRQDMLSISDLRAPVYSKSMNKSRYVPD